MEGLSPRALLNLRWLVKLWRYGHRNGAAFDLNINEFETYEAHLDVLALPELEERGYVKLTEDENLRSGWTLGADLSKTGIRLAEDPAFDTSVPPDLFPWP